MTPDEEKALRAEVAALREAACEHGPILCSDHVSAGRRFDIGCVICTGDETSRDLAEARAELTDLGALDCPTCTKAERARAFLHRDEARRVEDGQRFLEWLGEPRVSVAELLKERGEARGAPSGPPSDE